MTVRIRPLHVVLGVAIVVLLAAGGFLLASRGEDEDPDERMALANPSTPATSAASGTAAPPREATASEGAAQPTAAASTPPETVRPTLTPAPPATSTTVPPTAAPTPLPTPDAYYPVVKPISFVAQHDCDPLAGAGDFEFAIIVEGNRLDGRGTKDAPVKLNDGESVVFQSTAGYRILRGANLHITLEVTEWDVLAADPQMDRAQRTLELPVDEDSPFGTFGIALGEPESDCQVRLNLSLRR